MHDSDLKLHIYIWVIPSRSDFLTQIVMELLKRLELFSGRSSVIISKSLIKAYLTEHESNIDFITEETLTDFSNTRNLIPIMCSNVTELEREIENLFDILKKNNFNNIEKPIFINEIKDLYSKSEFDLIINKKKFLKYKIKYSHSIRANKPQHVFEHILKAENYLKNLNIFPRFIPKTNLRKIRKYLLTEHYKNLLSAQVEIAYFIHSGTDPVEGWLETLPPTTDREQNWEITNPFLGVSIDPNLQGAITKIEYLPRKFLLNKGLPGLFFTVHDNKDCLELNNIHKIKPQKVNGTEFRIMRQQPDLFGIRFDERPYSKNKLDTISICKSLYFKSGLGSFMPNSTTGFTAEYWIEDENKELTDSDLFTYLHFPILFPAPKSNLQLRALTSFNGESEELFRIEDDLLIAKQHIKSGLFGLRLINSLTHFILDIRFNKHLENISLKIIEDQAENCYLDILFGQDLKNFSGYNNLQTLQFCIY